MKTILVLTDFSKNAEHAANYAMQLAAKANAQVVFYNAFYVLPVFSTETGIFPYYQDYHELGTAEMKKLGSFADRILAEFKRTNKTTPPVIYVKSSPGTVASNVHEIVHQKKIWMIVMGSKSKENEFDHFLLGSECNAIIDHANCPVLLVPPKAAEKPIPAIAFATDLQPAERKPFKFITELADLWQSEITVVHVCAKGLSAEEKAANYLRYKKIAPNLKENTIYYEDIRASEPAVALARYVEKNKTGILAIVHKKRSIVGKLLHPSITKDLVRFHKVPLLVL